MEKKRQKTVTCQIRQKQKIVSEVVPGYLLRESLVETIRKKYPEWSSEGFICNQDLNQIREGRIQDMLKEEMGELSNLESAVVKSLVEHELMSRDVNASFDRELTVGERLSDKVAEYGGSWRFIISFAGIFVVWIAINSGLLLSRSYDPYPFILLNLILSCLAAIQAPIIMMSQNRQESKDRLRSEYDYKINLKAELEIRNLHEKVDHLLTHQWQRMMEIQQMQIELMEEVVKRRS
ncbi:MAG: hypothetical protein A2Y62_07970 [Candidatus Fischerbacteria bacterium RBG_13_37_8]|uniref:Cyclic nucleotide-binding protein n=1 Tax=Candidatus Fischerbacteria bacterium RBG_13_37_8 TaxID=1817863 RepID=A0A1F5V591_9BACT|nr:MAG: hypothetical protein A2Y62_07970 [Candidatus Fischerbacteria bacterium RBG_13_37_8]